MAHLTLLRAFLIALALVGCVEQPLPTNRPVQIALNWFPEHVTARTASAPLVALFAPIQTSPWCIKVRRDSGARQCRDPRRESVDRPQRCGR